MKTINLLAVLTIYVSAMVGNVQAEIKKRRAFIPVQVPLQNGEIIKRDMELVIFENDVSKEAKPVVIFGHGYPGNNQNISTGLWLLSHRKALNEFVKLGFNVVMPLRIGQGGTGGQTLEHGCNRSSEDFAEVDKSLTHSLFKQRIGLSSKGLQSQTS